MGDNMKKTDFVKYFCNYEISKVDIYYLYDLDTYSYELSTSNIKKILLNLQIFILKMMRYL